MIPVVILVLSILLYRLDPDRFDSYSFERSKEAKLELIAQKTGHCSYCGHDEVTRTQYGDGRYCGSMCSLAALRKPVVILSYASILTIFNSPFYLVLSVTMAFVSFLGLELHKPSFRFRRMLTMSPSNSKSSSKSSQSRGTNISETSSKSTQDVKSQDMIYVEDLDIETRVCCYQTARLQEKFCKCGRAVNPELLEYFG